MRKLRFIRCRDKEDCLMIVMNMCKLFQVSAINAHTLDI